MKKLLFILLLFSCSAYAQNFPGYYVTLKQDTIKCNFILYKKSYNQFDFSIISKKVILLDSEGVKKFKPNEIVCFWINTSETEIFKFVSIKGNKKSFFQEIICGKISLYKSYATHPYDGSLAIIPVAMKDNRLIYLNVINKKQRIYELLKDNEHVSEKWKAVEINNWTGSSYDTKEIEIFINEYNNYK